MNKWKRLAAGLLVLALMFSFCQMPLAASAAETEGVSAEAAQTLPQETSLETTVQTLPQETVLPNPTESTGADAVTEPATQPSTEAATEPTTEATTEPTTEVATEPTTESTIATENTEETAPVVNQLTTQLGAGNTLIQLSLPSDEPADTILTAAEGEPVDAQMLAIMQEFSIQNVLDYFIWDLTVDLDIDSSLRADITFDAPYLRMVSPDKAWMFLVGADGQIEKLSAGIGGNSEKYVTNISTSLTGFHRTARLIFISEDSPGIESTSGGGFTTYPEYAVRASNGAISGIGDAQGGLTYHCWADNGDYSPAKPAICLDSDRLFGSGDNAWNFGWCTASNTNDDEGPTSSWKDLSQSVRNKLVLLCAYGLSEWSPSGRFRDVNGGNNFAAMQLVAWEWVNGVSEGTYTSRYNGTVQSVADEMRDLVRTNPDNVDPAKTSVYVIWPNSQKLYNGRYVWGQTLIALWNVEYGEPDTGSLSVRKGITGSGTKANWRMELYSSASSAANATGYIDYAYTDANGTATFADLAAGTYYVREAPASRQDRVNTTGWTLSAEVKTGTVSAGSTTNAGTITNTAPTGGFQVTKTVKGGGSPNGWRFEAYTSAAAANAGGTNYAAYAYSGANGIVSFSGLSLGTYYVREAPASRQDRVDSTGWTMSTAVLTATVTANSSDNIGTISNTAPPGGIAVKKSVNTTTGTEGKLNGWIFQISDKEDFPTILTTVTTDDSGSASTGLTLMAGTYYVREAPYASQTRTDKDGFILDETVCRVNVTSGGVAQAFTPSNATATNHEKGRIRVFKGVEGTTADANSLSNWLFLVLDSDGKEVTTIQTGADGYGTTGYLMPGSYTVQEAPRERQTRQDLEQWTLSEEKIPVTVAAGALVDAFPQDGHSAVNLHGKLLHIQKVPNCSDATLEQIDGNAMYSLAGAKYDIVVDSVTVETLVTDAEGMAVAKTLFQAGDTGTLVETEAPTGYLLNNTPVAFTIPSGAEAYTVEVSDIPTFDPARFTLKKVDAITDAPMGDATFEGAVYRWDYFDNLTHSGTPVRTWYFTTDADGRYGYEPQYLANSSQYASDPLYLNGSGERYALPLGSVTITEVLAPSGYSIMQPLYGTITQNSSGSDAKWEWVEESAEYLTEISGGYSAPEPQDEASFGSLSIQKVDKDLGTEIPEGISFAGCQFSVYNRSANAVKVGDYAVAQPGEVCYVLTVDESGKAFTEAIFPQGTYEVKETKGNDFFTVNEEWSYTFSVVEGKTQFTTECANSMISIVIHVQKTNEAGDFLEGAKFILEWSEDGETWVPVSFSEELSKGGCSSENLAEDGSLTTDETGYATFSGLYPLGSYRIIEVATPNGYSLLTAPIMVEIPTYEDNYEVTYQVVDGYVFNLPKTGSVSMTFISLGVALSLVAGTLALAYWKKKQ